MSGVLGTPNEPPSISVAEPVLSERTLGLPSGQATPASASDVRLRGLFDSNFEFVWRSLRRLGVPQGTIDDATQEVFLVASRRLGDIELGRERSFLFATALRIASDARRHASRREWVGDDALAQVGDPSPRPDELADRPRQREVLDRVLAAMELDLRAVFVLYELEEMTMAEIATTLGLPPGTVASRLRRARDEFRETVARVRRPS
jgi:RNA polymerase sigma-70 factor (ECF subfamily)